jgi:hypothetical protein
MWQLRSPTHSNATAGAIPSGVRVASLCFLFWLPAAVAQQGCGIFGDCPNNNVPPRETAPVITVMNAVTGERICDATIVCRFSVEPTEPGSIAAQHEAALCAVDRFSCPDASTPLITPPDASTSDCQYGIPSVDVDGSVDRVDPLTGSCTLFVSKPGFQSVTVPNVGPRVTAALRRRLRRSK